MIIHGLTVCVDYAEYLAVSIGRWMAGLASLTIVTVPGDAETCQLAAAHGAKLLVTDTFYRDGAAFNKGRAMEEARRLMPWKDWILFFDADVVPPLGFELMADGSQPGFLYGCRRVERGQDVAGDVSGVGYFQLFHSEDPQVQVGAGETLIDRHWMHGGNYDNAFMDRWRGKGIPIRSVPFTVEHLGARRNWFGRNKPELFDAMQAERRKRGGSWQHERIEVTA